MNIDKTQYLKYLGPSNSKLSDLSVYKLISPAAGQGIAAPPGLSVLGIFTSFGAQ